jgi:hypothetical protein
MEVMSKATLITWPVCILEIAVCWKSMMSARCESVGWAPVSQMLPGTWSAGMMAGVSKYLLSKYQTPDQETPEEIQLLNTSSAFSRVLGPY